MDKELEFTLQYWRDRANFFEQMLGDIKVLKVNLQDQHIERLEDENSELKSLLVKLAEAILAQLKKGNDEVILKDEDAALYVKAHQSKQIQLDTIEMSTRATHRLKYKGCKTLGDVCLYTESELLRMGNFGRITLNEVKEILSSHGLSLKSA